jgi:hypothetical protein
MALIHDQNEEFRLLILLQDLELVEAQWHLYCPQCARKSKVDACDRLTTPIQTSLIRFRSIR